MNRDLETLNFKEILSKIKAVVFDIDGVLSSSTVNINEVGYLQRTTSVKDGFAIKCAVRKGLVVAIISGGFCEKTMIRYKNLGVEDVIMGSVWKTEDLENLKKKYNLKNEEILYMGDDIPDFQIMKMVGLPCCPVDAADEIKEIALYVSDRKGGEGCVRDVIEQVMRVQKTWLDEESFAAY